MVDHFMDSMYMYRSWVDSTTISDDCPILLEFEFEGKRNHFPFKFIHSWIMEEEFKSMVCENWQNFDMEKNALALHVLVKKLNS